MKKIERFLNELYSNLDLSNEEKNEMKEEMRSHLYEHIEDLKEQGYTEEQAIDLALQNFGGNPEIITEYEKSTPTKLKNKWFVLSMLFASLIFLTFSLSWGFNEHTKNLRRDSLHKISAFFWDNEQLPLKSLKKEIDRSIENRAFNDIEIFKESNMEPVNLTTKEGESLKVENSFLFHTPVEEITVDSKLQGTSYIVRYSYNTVNKELVFTLVSFFFLGFLITFLYWLKTNIKEFNLIKVGISVGMILFGLYLSFKSIALFTVVPDGGGIGLYLGPLEVSEGIPNEKIKNTASIIGLIGISLLALPAIYGFFKINKKQHKKLNN